MKKLITIFTGLTVFFTGNLAQASEASFLKEVKYYTEYYKMYELAKEAEEDPTEVLKLGYKVCDVLRQGMTYQEVQKLMLERLKDYPKETVVLGKVIHAAARNLCYYPTSGVASYAPWMNNNSSSSGGISGGGGGGGGCDSPSDRASDGSRCGGRAASARSGGR